MAVEFRLVRREGFELTIKPAVVLLLPLLQLQLPVYHCLLPLSNGDRLRVDVLLLLDGCWGRAFASVRRLPQVSPASWDLGFTLFLCA
jgi:hypothetical protein